MGKLLKISSPGAGATTGAASATIAIPNDGSGNAAKAVIVSVEGATYVQAGDSSVAATTGDVIVNPGSPLYIEVAGQTHIAHLQLTAAQRITVTPIELG